MTKHRRRWAGGRTMLVAAVVCGVSGCGSAQEQDARAAVERFFTATESNQVTRACAMLAPRALEALNGPCDQALPELGIEPAPVESVETWGDNAIVHTAPGAVFLHEFETGWLVTGAQCQGRPDQPYECEVGGP